MIVNPCLNTKCDDGGFLLSAPDGLTVSVTESIFLFLLEKKNVFFLASDFYRCMSEDNVELEDQREILTILLKNKIILSESPSIDHKLRVSFPMLLFSPFIHYSYILTLTDSISHSYRFYKVLFPLSLVLNIFLFIYTKNLVNYNITLSTYFAYILISILHELGHLSAMRFLGINHGSIGIALVGPIPMFFSNLNNIHLIPRERRVLVNSGGIYIQSIVTTLCFLAFLVSHTPTIAILAFVSCYHIFYNLLPLPAYDGYYIVKELLPRTHDMYLKIFVGILMSVLSYFTISSVIRNGINMYSVLALIGIVGFIFSRCRDALGGRSHE